MLVPYSYTVQNSWDLTAANPLWLLTPDEVLQLPGDTVLTSIMGNKVEAGKLTDMDTRFGYLAYGLLESQFVVAIPEGESYRQ